jgi:hypothetical protein
LDANQAVSFFASISGCRSRRAGLVQSISLANDKTQEKLVIKGRDIVTISRYPMGANEEEWSKELWKIDDPGWWQKRRIDVDLKI